MKSFGENAGFGGVDFEAYFDGGPVVRDVDPSNSVVVNIDSGGQREEVYPVDLTDGMYSGENGARYGGSPWPDAMHSPDIFPGQEV
jgi:hypothetical protein